MGCKLKRNFSLFFLILGVFLLVTGCGGKKPSAPVKNKEKIEIPLAIVQFNDSPYVSVRNQAFEEIKKNPNLYLPTLKILLLHGDSSVKIAVAKILGKMGEVAQEMVPELTQALDDSDTDVQALSSWALGKMGHASPQTISKLMGLLINVKDPKEGDVAKGDYDDRKDNDVLRRQSAALALGRLAPQLSNNAVAHRLSQTFLYDPNSQVRLHAALALEKIAPHMHCSHVSTAQTIREILNRVYLYAHLCFREDRSLEEGATEEEKDKYYKELRQEFIPENFDWEKDNLQSLASLKAEQKYSNEDILTCAQENFKHVSSLDEKWFKLFDDYGYSKEEFKPFQKEWLGGFPLISIGNTHPLAVSHGKILFELAQFFSDYEKPMPTLLIETRYTSNVKEYYNDRLRQNFQSHPTLVDHTDPLPYVQELGEIEAMDAAETTLASSRWLDSPRNRVQEAYALTYPSAKIIPVDLGEERINAACGVHISTLQNLIDHRSPQETFLLFYGDAHIARMGTNDSSEIEAKIQCDSDPLKTFTIGQFTSPNMLLEEALNLSLLYEAQRIPVQKFSFPVKGTPHSNIDDFFGYWEGMVDKYNNFKRSRPQVPLYIYLAQAQREGSLSFFNSIAPYDLFLIPAAEDSTRPWDIQKDSVYLFLKEYLGNHIQKLSWISD